MAKGGREGLEGARVSDLASPRRKLAFQDDTERASERARNGRDVGSLAGDGDGDAVSLSVAT